MIFLAGLQIFLGLGLIIIIIFQKPKSEGLISTNHNTTASYNTRATTCRITTCLIFSFFINSLLLGRHTNVIKKNKDNVANPSGYELVIEKNRKERINVPILK